MGESFGIYKMGLDEEVIQNITSANVACGFHAGDSLWMKRTVELAEQYNVALGAHPSYPDLKGFGRRNMNIDPSEVKADIIYQSGALSAFTSLKKLQHVKPHGAMYNQAVNDPDLAKSICEAILEFDEDVILLALTGSKWVEIAQDMGLRVAKEVVIDNAKKDPVAMKVHTHYQEFLKKAIDITKYQELGYLNAREMANNG